MSKTKQLFKQAMEGLKNWSLGGLKQNQEIDNQLASTTYSSEKDAWCAKMKDKRRRRLSLQPMPPIAFFPYDTPPTPPCTENSEQTSDEISQVN